MANRGYGYQYETSPRKLEPEYKPANTKKKKTVQPKKVSNKKQPKKKQKKKMSFETKFFIHSMLAFSIIFAIIAGEALVKQRYKEKEGLKQEYNELLASMNIAGSMSDDVRALASQYGMQTKSATLIDLGTSDYIESAENQAQAEEVSWLEKILNFLNFE